MPRKTTVPSAAQINKELRCLELKRAGETYDAIARAENYKDRSGAKKAVDRALARTLQEPADELRKIEGDRLDRLQTAYWDDAMLGDVAAGKMVLGVMARRASLYGLDVIKLEHSGPAGNPLIIEVLPQLVPQMSDPKPPPKKRPAKKAPAKKAAPAKRKPTKK